MTMFARVSKRREAVDCFNCSSSHRPCDRTRHRCGTCSQNSELCQGYPRELQWLTGVTSRGKRKGLPVGFSASSGEWESAAEPNKTYTYKKGRPRKERRQEPKSPKIRTDQGMTSQQSPPATGSGQGKYHLSVTGSEGSPASTELTQSPGSTTADVLDPQPFIFESLDTIIDHFDPSPVQRFCGDNDALPLLTLQPESMWQDGNGASLVLTMNFATSCNPISPTIPSMPILGYSELFTLYDTELCTVPLTFDFYANPFRCRGGLSQDSKYLEYALLAFSMQHVSRMNDAPQEQPLAQQITAYRHSAAALCAMALLAAPGKSESVVDTILVLFALDTLMSAIGPWNTRLLDAYHKIESIGGMGAVKSSSRFRAQLAMFIWWDCSIALLARSESVFPSSYYEFVVSSENDASWNIFTLSGVPKELFQYCRELVQLASEKEQVSKMRYASFDVQRVLQLERCIHEYTEGELSPQDMAGNEEVVQNWHDYCNASNAWKYALLLYISRVLKWDGISDARLHVPEITSLSRLLLDSVRCCRPESTLQKQLLFPIFLAGSESFDAYSRKFVKEYCEEWYRKCRYSMFREASILLQDIWAQRDLDRNDFTVWWGSVIGSRKPNAPEFLFG